MGRGLLASVVGLCLASGAYASPSGQIISGVSVIPGTRAPAARVPTLTDTAAFGATGTPRLRLGVSGSLQVGLPGGAMAWASWGVWRDQALCDTCGDGRGPGWGGDELLGSSDATVAVQRRWLLGDPPARGEGDGADQMWLTGRGRSAVPWLILRADAVLPASRDAIACNPFYGAPGAGAIFGLPAGGSTVQIAASGRRPIYRYDAAPVGRCAPPLRGAGTVRTLTGEVAPTPWESGRFASSNPTFTARGSVTWANPTALISPLPDALFSALSVGLASERVASDPQTEVSALTGAVPIGASSNPVRVAIPWSVLVGVSATKSFDLRLSLANQLPSLSADPGGTFRAQTSSTAATASVAGRF